MDTDYIEKAQEPEVQDMAGESIAPECATECVVHVPVNAHGHDIDWNALQTWLAFQAQTFIEESQRLVSTKQAFHAPLISHRLNDEELEKALEGLPSWDEVEHPDLSFLSKADYSKAARHMSRRTIKGIEKWL